MKTITDVRVDLSGLEVLVEKVKEHLGEGNLTEAALYGQKIFQQSTHIAATLELLADKEIYEVK